MNKPDISIKCHKISEGVVTGEVLVSNNDICFYLADPDTGKIIEKGHDLEGKSVAGKILVFPGGKGSSVVQTDGLYQLIKKDNAPIAMVIQYPDTVLVASAIIMEIPLVDRIEERFYELISNGTKITVDANNERISFE